MGREILAAATGRPCSLRRFVRAMLRIPACLTLHARRVVLVLRAAVSPLWQMFVRTLEDTLPLAPPARA